MEMMTNKYRCVTFEDYYIFEINGRVVVFKRYTQGDKNWLDPKGHYLDDNSQCYVCCDFKITQDKHF